MINLNLNSLFYFSAQNDGYIKVKTPFTYSNGKEINIYLKKEEPYILITDLGETIGNKYINCETFEKFCFINSLLYFFFKFITILIVQAVYLQMGLE